MVTKISKSQKFSILALIIGLGALLSACNSDSSDDTTYTYVTPSTVGITNFTLKANTNILSNLDSVFFSIDMANAVIFNADSLPKGTKISKLIPVITFSATPSVATIVEGDTESTEHNYLTSPNDSIDFNNPVKLLVVSQDGNVSKTFRLKVNVHQLDPDCLAWDEIASSNLPSRNPNPIEQRSVTVNGTVYCLVHESDGFTLSTTTNPDSGVWEKQPVSVPTGADVRSFEATAEALYILAQGTLYASSDNGQNWSPVADDWHSVIGEYNGTILGLRTDADGSLWYTQAPATSYFSDYKVDADFPVEGRSNLITTSSKWSTLPTGVFTGGITASGAYSALTWGFDGSNWAKLSVSTPPATADATLIPYYVYRQTSTAWIQTEMQATLLYGGKLADGSVNPTIYVSYDSGITWQEASSNLQLPDYIPATYMADAAVIASPKAGNLSDAWTRHASDPLPNSLRKISYQIDGYDITWECPYIYLIGGVKADGALNTYIWRGVLNRLTFIPLF